MLTFLQKNIPIFLYFLSYLFFVLIGITFFVLNNHLYISLYELFSGVGRPIISTSEQWRDLLLISYISPLLLIVSFYIILNKNETKHISEKINFIFKFDPKILFLLYSFIVGFLIYRLLHFISFQDIFYAYTNYKSMINIRVHLFNHFNSFDWILMYSFVPALTGILYFNLKSNFLRYLVLSISIVLLMYTMQKRYVLLLIIFICMIHIFQQNYNYKEILKNSLGILGMLGIIFFAQTYLPASYLTSVIPYQQENKLDQNKQNHTNASKKTQDVGLNVKSTQLIKTNQNIKERQIIRIKNVLMKMKSQGKLLSPEEVSKIVPTLGFDGKYLNYLFYVGAALNRSSIPSVYYFEFFPTKINFIGLEISHFLPFKEKINEGKLMWEYLNGDSVKGGAIAVPFNFSLYARVGVVGTLIISIIIGAFLGGIWSIIRNLQTPLPKAILSSMFCILMVFLSMDNFRSSVFTAYGIFWWVLCFLLCCLLSHLSSLKFFPHKEVAS